ncbi:hypothetical protein E2C01_002485 [Portunus trituberculatus]|uniref:Uncharacterized protein n=1 Tax=Portunus trituberculatus TaxID=210409 RepID=A0A5B7CJT2_PORTR|nr:hypothetical protein [Portunus trituberculatus]
MGHDICYLKGRHGIKYGPNEQENQSYGVARNDRPRLARTRRCVPLCTPQTGANYARGGSEAISGLHGSLILWNEINTAVNHTVVSSLRKRKLCLHGSSDMDRGSDIKLYPNSTALPNRQAPGEPVADGSRPEMNQQLSPRMLDRSSITRSCRMDKNFSCDINAWCRI